MTLELTSMLTSPQARCLRQVVGLEPPGPKPWPQTVAALRKKGLVVDSAQGMHATPLGRCVAVMKGWIPTGDQQFLIRSLALPVPAPGAGHGVRAGIRYDLPWAGPATVLRRFEVAGIAYCCGTSGLWRATALGEQLAALLRGDS